jgi:hypothetical protein
MLSDATICFASISLSISDVSNIYCHCYSVTFCRMINCHGITTMVN